MAQRYYIFNLDISGFPSLVLAHVFFVARWQVPVKVLNLFCQDKTLLTRREGLSLTDSNICANLFLEVEFIQVFQQIFITINLIKFVQINLILTI